MDRTEVESQPIRRNRFFQRAAALAEILSVLVLGNVMGSFIYGLIVPETIAAGSADPVLIAGWEGLLIVLRLGCAALIGFSLLYYRRGLTPRRAGLSRNQQSLASLVQTGFLLGVFTTLPISLLFGVHALLPFGQGLEAWWTYSESDIDLAFWIGLLATSVLIPPLTEEILIRGYQRVRLVESYGVMGGVVLTGVVFALSHARYLAADPLLLLFMLTLIISSVSWTYLAQKTGSIIPSMVAHAITNGVATAILFNVWLPMVVLIVIAVIMRRPIVRGLLDFAESWRSDTNRNSLWTGFGCIVLVFVPGLVLLPILGRLPTLMSIGGLLLLVTVVNVVMEKRSADAN